MLPSIKTKFQMATIYYFCRSSKNGYEREEQLLFGIIFNSQKLSIRSPLWLGVGEFSLLSVFKTVEFSKLLQLIVCLKICVCRIDVWKDPSEEALSGGRGM